MLACIRTYRLRNPISELGIDYQKNIAVLKKPRKLRI